MSRPRKQSKTNRNRDRAEEAGRQQAELHFLQPGRPEPAKVRGKLQNRACAERWNELAGRYPSWYTHYVKREDGWWIINADGCAVDVGPYDTKADAEDDGGGMADFMAYQNEKGYMTCEKGGAK